MEESYREKVNKGQRERRRELSQKFQKTNHPEKGRCCFVHPIKSPDHIQAMKSYLYKKSARDYLLFILGINNGLRNSSIPSSFRSARYFGCLPAFLPGIFGNSFSNRVYSRFFKNLYLDGITALPPPPFP